MLLCYNSNMIRVTKGGELIMKKQPQITEQTKSTLRDAFWQLYSDKPIEKITIKEITDIAGYNRGTFYLYYNDVYDILAQIEEDLLEKIQEAITFSIQQKETQDFIKNLSIFVELMQTYSKYSIILLSDQGDPQFTTRLKEIIWPLLNRFFIPSEGLTEYQIDLLAEFYLSGILAAVSKWNSNPQMSIDQLITFMIPNIFPMK